MPTAIHSAVPRRPIGRILLILVGLAGGVGAGIYFFSGGLRSQRAQVIEKAIENQQKRQRVAATQSFIRPLDPAVGKAILPHEFNRRVLALYNSLDTPLDKAEEGVTHEEVNHAHLKAELILNHLGITVDLRDVNAKLLDDNEMKKYRGVVAWFAGQKVKNASDYLRWLVRQTKAGRKVITLDGFGASEDEKGRKTPPNLIREAYAALGLNFRGNFSDDPDQIEITYQKKEMVAFERPLPLMLEYFEEQKLVDPHGKAWLRLRRKDRPQSESDMVVTSSTGGYVAPGYAITESRLGINFVMQWRINPFFFFSEALGLQRSPRPDFTTINGSRVFYSHIDGDGLPSISEIDRQSTCGDYTRKHILKAYDLPVTVSFVVAGIEPPPKGRGSPHLLETARRIAKLPNVEVASHGFAHPMNWRAYNKAIVSWDVPGYSMNAEKEIAYSIKYINAEISPPGKPVMVMLWTGWCNPDEEQLSITYREGVYNLNGGDPIMDGQFPSYLHLVPPIHKVGAYLQYYTSGPNDFILTEEWTPPYHRWANLIQTLERTGEPRRLYPMNVYYHFYISQKPSAMAAMRNILNWVLEQEPTPLWASEYIDIVRDFADMRIEKVQLPAPNRKATLVAWRVLNSGYARTIRFDFNDRHLDLERSKGVLGYQILKKKNVTYVHLDDSHEHLIVLTPTPPKQPYLVRATSYVDAVTIGKKGIQLKLRGYGKKMLSWANMVPQTRYDISAKTPQGDTLKNTVSSDKNGRLKWSGDINGKEIHVTIVKAAGN